MDEKDIPDTSNVSNHEVFSIFLAIIAVIAGFTSMSSSFTDPSRGFAFFAITTGLASIAFAILAVGRKINNQ